MKLISSFLLQTKFRAAVEDTMSAPREMQAGASQGSILSATLYSIYITYTSPPKKTPGVYLALFANETSMYGQITMRVVIFSESYSTV
jgi:hypothetical protein